MALNSMMKNIIFDCERMKYENTGLFHYCLNLGTQLAKFAEHGREELSLYTPPGTEGYFGHGVKNIQQTELHKLRLPSLKNYNIWHATYQESHYVPFRNRNIKVVLTVHDLNYLYDESKPSWKKERYLRHIQSVIDRADVIVCVSDHSKADLLFYCDLKNKPVHMVHNGTNSLQTPVLSKNSYKPRRPFIFSLGTINRKKNFHTLLPLVSKDKDIELVIAGRKDDEAYCRHILDTADKMGITDNINLVGQVSEYEKSWYYNNCYAFAFPSIAEGFGLPVAEAMSVGKPLFLSNKAALPEIGGNVAFYFPDFSETIMQETFAAGMKQYKRFNMQEQIIKKGKEYCWENAARDYWKIYRSLY